MSKKYRVWYHYRKAEKAMTVHFRGKCICVQNIVCQVPCETKWNKRQPQLVMQGWASQVKIEDNVAYIS